MKQLKERDIERARGLAQRNAIIDAHFQSKGAVQEQAVEAICGLIANYATVYGREAAIKLCEANVSGLEDAEITVHADSMHEAFNMFYDMFMSVGPDAV